MDKYIKTDALEEWLYKVALNNIDVPITFDKTCESIVERLNTGGYRFFEETGSAVAIVRCEDCEWWIEPFEIDGYGGCLRLDFSTKADDFCSYGERTTDNDYTKTKRFNR